MIQTTESPGRKGGESTKRKKQTKQNKKQKTTTTTTKKKKGRTRIGLCAGRIVEELSPIAILR